MENIKWNRKELLKEDMSNSKINDESNDVVGSGNKWAGGQSRINAKFVKGQRDIGSRNAGKDNDTE